MKSVWIITKDIRLEDNLTLKMALHYSNEVYPIFVLNTDQIKNGGSNSCHFLFESLEDLHNSLKKYGSCVNIVDYNIFPTFIHQLGVTNGFILKGFTQFEKNRNSLYSRYLNLTEIDDCLGMPRNFFLKSDGAPYRVFSPYARNIIERGGLVAPDNTIPENISKCKAFPGFDTFSFLSLKSMIDEKPHQANWVGGLTEGKMILSNRYYNLQIFLMEKQYGVENVRLAGYVRRERKDISPHVKFGTVSPRAVFHSGLVEEDKDDKMKEHIEGKGILWRALYYNLLDQNLVILKNRNVQWYIDSFTEDQTKYFFNLWCTGNTGYDFVDAGIHQLLKTGIMDNEVRMLTANFLVFGMGINWRKGEEFFRKYLVDYDWSLNVGNWAWCAQVGMDNPSPNSLYGNRAIRIFNPDSYKTKTLHERNYRESYIQKWLNRAPGSLPKQFDFDAMVRYNLNFY